ncbi:MULTISPECIES: glycosyltransferase [Maribacter]|uniref:Glycosyltransferase family 2 protein n=1 Tax=Maribacter flavus TaxID=1658664 RepID=A0A5B2TXP1_9FLAO|nr:MULTISPECIES: glycosyltransferase family 2 protein [Maribacter]KAA2219104.1 glycosyltransferase family 2 protein [Maribacter flavus]MDC6404029.1 glycosyltransferase family 2 protein [Maribacter sp. PR66]MEE1971170.1 glycosyltransferase family 2 protein [Maribacter flavus]
MKSENTFTPELNATKQSDTRPSIKNGFLLKTRLQSFIQNANAWGVFVMGSTFVLMIASIYVMYVLQSDYDQFNQDRLSTTFGMIFMVIATGLFAFKAGFFVYTLYRYFRYKAIESVSNEELPTCTVIVPAYNEGKQVYATLMSLANSDYPVEKLQLLSIDDGSKDDTWYWMQEAKRVLGDRVVIYQQPKNMGKRHALYRGFNEGTGEVFVTVDSDSIVKKDTLRNLVSPFVTNEKCGAVAGNIRVLNNEKALIPKMLDVSFVLSFEFVRSAESSLNSVLCTPGALAAYRRTAVFACLDAWINQTFMGQPSDIGEDRAMTNMILKQGYHVLFQRNAYAYTNVPEKYKGLYKMFIRWGRSNVRENIEMSKYVFTNFREGSKAGTRLLFFSQATKIVMSYPFLLFMLYFVVTHPLLFVASTLTSILVLSTFPVIFYAKRYNFMESFWAYSYSVMYTFGLFWITPYAIATANRRGWLTRGLAEKK